MHIGRHIVQELVFLFGEPRVERWDVALTPAEQDEVDRHIGLRRAHDVSLLIRRGAGAAEELAVIRKPGYPEGAFRIPSGGVHPEESFVDGAVREGFEATGLVIAVEDYLLQVHANFQCEARSAKWTTHVMLARVEGGELAPRDSQAIEAARFIGWDELTSQVNPRLLDSGLGRLAYRARLHDCLREIVSSTAAS